MYYLIDTLILLAAAVLIVPLAQFLRINSVLGFLLAGVLVGPAVSGLISEVREIRAFAELGVVFLLFIIGIELKPRRLWLMRRMVFGMGTLQVVLTGAVLTLLIWMSGTGLRPALVLGLGLALSSTAFVLQLLMDRKQLGAPQGRGAIAVLLLQDLAVVPLLALVAVLALPDVAISDNVVLKLVEIIVAIIVVVIAGHYLLQPVLHRIALYGVPEIFLATTLLLVLGVGALMEHVGMSMSMGAFIAGLMIADSEFRHQILADIQPFRGLLLGLFFMSVGMTLDLQVLLDSPLRIMVMLVILLLVKSLIIWFLARLYGLGKRISMQLALLLSQGGEFGFVLFGAAVQNDLFTMQLYHESVLVVVLSMAITPLLLQLQLGSMAGDEVELPRDACELPDGGRPDVVIAGFGRMGKRIATILQKAGVTYVAIEQRPTHVAVDRRNGYAVYYGDASSPEVLKSAGVDKARLMVVAIDNADLVSELVAAIRKQYPSLPIYARGHSRARCEQLVQKGATAVASENLEASLQLAHFALQEVGVDEDHSLRLMEEYRESYYNYLKREHDE